LLKEHSISYTLKSELNGELAQDSLVIDIYGILARAYAVSSVCIVGCSFINYGGQNIIEPALLGKAIITGPYMSNFRDAYELLVSKRAITTANDGYGIAQTLKELLGSKDAAAELGRRAQAAINSQRGALEKNVQIIQNVYING
jgi:3-deoxy-D-manno-octulosonic-acid transferase